MVPGSALSSQEGRKEKTQVLRPEADHVGLGGVP